MVNIVMGSTVTFTKIKCSDKELIEIAKSFNSVSQIMREIGYTSINGYAHFRFKTRLEKLGIKIDPVKARCWNKGLVGKNTKVEYYLKLNGPSIKTVILKRKLLKDKIKQNKCEICSITNWLNKPIKFHLDHIDGNNKNNCLDNLRILCPNCHSQTPTYAKMKHLL